MPSTHWRLWSDAPFPPAINMAIDDLLLDQINTQAPILRFYDWSTPCYTLGYFQPFTAAPQDGTTIIRRPSGGGVVNHSNDFTFSLTFGEDSALYQVDRFESYRQINQAVARTLQSLNITCILHDYNIPKELDRSLLVCFESPAKYDVISASGKLCGGAQRRHRHGMLHQGSILLDNLPLIDRLQLATALTQTFATVFDIEFIPFVPNEELLRLAEDLATARYESDTWNRKK